MPKYVKIRNLTELKRAITVGTEVKLVFHSVHPELQGLVRVVTKTQSNGFYSVIKNRPNHHCSVCNGGKGIWSDYGRSSEYSFSGSRVSRIEKKCEKNRVLYILQVLEKKDGEQHELSNMA